MADLAASGAVSTAWTRRSLLAAAPGLLLAPSVLAQASGIRLLRLNCFEIRVPDPAASIGFYQSLFGMPVQARADGRSCLRVGDGPQFMAIRATEPGEAPAITEIGYAVAEFDPGRVQAELVRTGFKAIDAPAVTEPGIAHPMSTWIRRRGDTEELRFADAGGLVVQLSGAGYCGGGGRLGEACDAPGSAPAGRIALQDLNHFTVFGSDGAGANRFYQETFGLSVQAYQGPGSPVTGIGDGKQFVMYAGGGGRGGAATPASIHHGSFNMRGFDVDAVRAALTAHGLRARGDGEATGPLMHYVSLRMPNRGGAEGGTPELYFTDPDGILLQLQDVTYCGGGGYLGNECLSGG